MRLSGSIIVRALFAIAVFVLFLRTPFYSDDYLNTAEVYPQGIAESNCNLTWGRFFTGEDVAGNIEKAVVKHYQEDTGRFVTAVLLRVFSALPRVAFAVVGTLFFIVLAGCICKFGGIGRRCSVAVWGLVLFTLLQENAVVWLAGSMNYAWPVAWTLPLVVLFISKRMEESPLSVCNSWMWLMIPLMTVAAGGHEVVCAPLGATVGIYWIGLLFKYRKIPFNGRLLMTFGYAIGSCMVVFAPSSLARASGMQASSVGYSILSKVCTLGYGLAFNPWFYVLVMALIVYWRMGKLRPPVDAGTWWCALAFGFEALMLMAFGNISPRAAWPFIVVSMILALRMLKLVKFAECRLAPTFGMVAVGLGLITMANTIVSTEIKRDRYCAALEKWRMSDLDVCIVPSSPDWLLGFLFDRSFNMREAIIWGTSGYDGKWNKALARLCGKNMLYGVTESQGQLLLDPGFHLDESFRLPVDGEWYFHPHEECLIAPIPANFKVGGISRDIGLFKAGGRPSVGDVMKAALFRGGVCAGGAGVFKTSVFINSFLRDVIYMTVYANRPVEGFVADFPTGRYAVLSCNRFRLQSGVPSLSLRPPSRLTVR